MSEIDVTVDETTLDITVAIPGPQGPAGTGGGGGSQTLADTLALGNDANALAIENLADPTNAQDADTKAARDAAITALNLGTAAQADTGDFDAAGSAAAAQAASQPLDADLTTLGGLDSSTSGAIASDGGGWIKKTYAQFKTALSLTKSDVGLGSVVNADTTTTANITDSTDKRFISDAQRTVLGNTSGTNTGDQTSVSGNAGTATKLATARNIDGQAFDGSADVTVIAPGTHAATGKTTPVDADELALVDSAASNVLKKLTWANLKATLKTYFDTLYMAAGGVSSAFGRTGAVVATTGDYTEAQISFSDITTNNVSTTKHGLAPKAPNDATKYLDGTGAYSVPASGASYFPPVFAPAAGVIVALPYVVIGAGGGSLALTDQSMILYPLVVQASRTLNTLTIRTNGGASTGATIRFGVYADSGGKPSGAPLYDSGAVVGTAGFSNISASPALALSAGRYWVAIVQQGAPSPTNITPDTVQGSAVLGGVNPDTATNALTPKNYVGYSQASIGSGALPSIGTLALIQATGSTNHPLVAATF